MEQFGPLYRPDQERDACGVGFVADVSGKRSYRILDMALECVTNLTHRGALDADAKTGDGAGVLLQIPTGFFAEEAARVGASLDRPEDLAVAMVFLPGRDDVAAGRCREALAGTAQRDGLAVYGWREVPVDSTVLGDAAARSQPRMEQLLVGRRSGLSDDDFERVLTLVRKETERWADEQGIEDFYVPSFSHRTIVYKGLLVAHQLKTFYQDLANPKFETALAIFHQRYSTNTFPNWVLAQPFRMLAHNGEINTLQGNRNWQRAREPELHSSLWGEEVERLKPIIQDEGGSDSAVLDNVLEAVTLSGRDPLHAMMMLIPEAWENMPNMAKPLRDFFEYHACISEPWDGPASIAFTDGVIVGATLDRNGLRPARYELTDDGILVMGSEVGMTALDEAHIVEKGRLGPGQIIAVDTGRGKLLKNDDIKNAIIGKQPYGEWVRKHLLHLDDYLKTRSIESVEPEHNLVQQQIAFGYTREELQYVIKPMCSDGKEPVGSMGDDTALAVFESQRRHLSTYFKQKFAQVSNPPIDPIREELVMSLDVYLGPRRSLFEETPEHARLLHLSSPLMVNQELDAIRTMNGDFSAAVLSCVFPVTEGPEGLDPALDRICREASEAIDNGKNVLILSDRNVDGASAPIPTLLAVGAVHHYLIREGKRMRASIVAETGDTRDVHQIALLLGYGASAVNPYLAFETITNMFFAGAFKELPDIDQAFAKYQSAVDAGVLKIMSKMGISCVSSYTGGQIFEALGLASEVIDRAFAGTPSRVEGIGLREIAEDVLARHAAAFQPTDDIKLDAGGFYKFRKGSDYHGFNPELVRTLHRAQESDEQEDFLEYRRLLEERADPTHLRDLLRFKRGKPIPLDEVQPIADIMTRFTTGAMSLGALSPEAHETVAIGMNRIGGKSDTGEGGEEYRRFYERKNGDNPNSKIKQVASGRFGVTPMYLAEASELEIKMAQGSKPGEGGQLPGHKVTAFIADIRHTLPGTPLISPPPHHDIYSIEDLAQLIYDLKMVNPRARVCVKLVAEEGVGTIAAGVVKGYADVIQISGDSGGTGASPLSSIKHAGLPWELGIAETQQVLVQNDLRSRVKLRVDGGFQTGRDVVVAALLGAEEYGFGTAVLVAIGCVMARQCHLNTCPVGVATQNEELREKFTGTPDDVIWFLGNVAQEVREILAEMGFHSLDELVGRTDLLEPVDEIANERARSLDLTPLLWMPEGDVTLSSTQERNDRAEEILDDAIIKEIADALDGKGAVQRSYEIRNIHRTVGARIAGEIAHRYRKEGLPPGSIELRFTGSAGQSFGAFCHNGLRLLLEGEANDYVCKGMGGGEVALRPPRNASFESHENVIMGNTVLYGATGGSLFAAGRAGERFAIRNSGAKAVVEGVGDHGCEYMTEGVVVILGETGRNFGAGMSNGIAYVLDEHSTFPQKVNPELIAIKRVTEGDDVEILHGLIQRHVQLTESKRGQEILDGWDRFRPLFWKVAPHSAMTEEGPQTIIRRHLESVRAALAVG